MLQIVIVVYKTTLEESESFRSLNASIDALTVPYSILVVNNSADVRIESGEGYTVVTPKENLMLAGAYNIALEEAKKAGRKYLMLLDQDTEVTREYIEELNRTLNSPIDDNIAALVPVVRQKSNNIQISPAVYNPSLGTARMHYVQAGTYTRCTSAINSCTVLSVKAIEAIGGFPLEFPLDGLDIIYFYLLYKQGLATKVINAVIYQNLSVYDYKHSMNRRRYLSIIKSEKQLAKVMGWNARLLIRLRFIIRGFKQLANSDKRRYSGVTFKSIFKQVDK